MERKSNTLLTAITAMLSFFSTTFSDAKEPILVKPPKEVTRPAVPIPKLKSEPKLLWEGQVQKNTDEIRELLEKLNPVILEEPKQISRLEFELDKLLDKTIRNFIEELERFPASNSAEAEAIIKGIGNLIEAYTIMDSEQFKKNKKVLGLRLKLIKELEKNPTLKHYYKQYNDRILKEDA